METKNMRIQRFILPLLLFGAIGLPAYAQAATLSFSPQSASHTVGSLAAINIYVSSPDQAMNAVSGKISFPKDKLEVAYLSKDGSIINLWVRDPSVSATLGEVSFGGIVLNPGFTGTKGKLLTVVFRVTASGNAPIHFLSGSVLANDGSGTNILTDLGKASFSLTQGSSAIATSTSAPPLIRQDIVPSETSTTPVVNAQPAGPSRIIFSTVDILSMLLAISSLVIVLALLWLYGLRQIRNARRHLKNETREAQVVFQKAYENLRAGVQEHLGLLTKKNEKTTYDLETESSLHRLGERLDQAEESIQKSIQKIEEGLK